MSYVRIEGHKGFVRDKRSGAIINTNKEEIEAAKKRKAERLNKDKELSDLKNEVSDIKKMLTKIVEKLDG
tara:strand:- start:143 stop:352 length:210 start_codon:yes stop_codon:yes gene_type:complete